VLLLGVEPEVLPPIVNPGDPVADVDPVVPLPAVPLPPIELVLPAVPLPLVDLSVLALPLVEPLVLPAVLPVPDVPGPVLDGLVVVLLDELDPGVPAVSRLLQALSESAATTASVATATCVRDVFIGKLLVGLFETGKGTWNCPIAHCRHRFRPACRQPAMVCVGQAQRQGFLWAAVEPRRRARRARPAQAQR
jgi:hypothetical protein